VLQGVLGPPTYPAALSQEHAQPAGANGSPRLLLQIAAQSLRCPDVEGQPQRGGRRLQRGLHSRQVGGIRPHRSARALGVRECSHPALRKAGQPVLHGRHCPPTPARDPLHRVTQRGRFAHLQPLPHPPGQIRALQLPLHLRPLLSRDRAADCTHAIAPSVLPPRAPSAPRLIAAYPLSAEVTRAY
jgi:hypothetical protein